MRKNRKLTNKCSLCGKSYKAVLFGSRKNCDCEYHSDKVLSWSMFTPEEQQMISEVMEAPFRKKNYDKEE